MTFLLANWRIIAFLIGAGGLVAAGWHAHTIYDAYHTQNAEIKAINDLGKGEVAIYKVNSDLDKAEANAQDICIDKRMPASFIRLLR